MKYAVYISNAEALSQIEDYIRPVDFDALAGRGGVDFWAQCDRLLEDHYRIGAQALINLPRDARFSRLYFGQEFCEYLVPSLEDLKMAYYTSRQLDWDFTYVTGTLTNQAMEATRGNLAFLQEETKNSSRSIEVVINDWGLLSSVGAEFPGMEIALGRLLIKQDRYSWIESPIPQKTPIGSQMLEEGDLEEIMENQLQALADSMLACEQHRDLLKELGVKHVDVDPLSQGSRIEPDWGFSFGFYYPWTYLTSSRACATSALIDPERYDLVSGRPCSRPCQQVNVELSKHHSIAVHRGNSFFMASTEMAGDYLAGKYPFDRLIYEPVIPI